MKLKPMTTSFALVLSAGAALTLLTVGAASLSASPEKKGDLHVTKECSAYTGQSGSFCTFTSSNLAAITAGSRIYYDQAFGSPAGMLDSNVLLSAGPGNWAVGRCTLDGGTGAGICTFSDGTGEFAGFQARIKVSHTGGPNYTWDGTYSFEKDK